MSSPLDYCMAVVRKRDYEHYLCTLYLPSPMRERVFALRALNVETASVREHVIELHLGEGKLRFWSEVIKSAYQKESRAPLEHPLALTLTLAIRECQLSQSWLQRLVAARLRELTPSGRYPELSDLEAYGEETHGSLLFLTLEAGGIRNLDLDHAASHIAKAAGIATCLRAVAPLASRRHRVDLPLSLLSGHRVSQQDVLKRVDSPGLREVALDLSSVAKSHLDRGLSIASQHTHTHPLLRRIFLCAVVYDRFLKKLQKCGFNLFDSRLQSRDGMLPLQLFIKLLRRKI